MTDEPDFRPKRVVAPDPPPYEPTPPDPVEAAQLAALAARGDRHPGEIIE